MTASKRQRSDPMKVVLPLLRKILAVVILGIPLMMAKKDVERPLVSSEERRRYFNERADDIAPATNRSANRDEPLQPLCLKTPFYGFTNNRVIALGKLMSMSKEEGIGRKIGLDTSWSIWYEQHFDPRPGIMLRYNTDGQCDIVFDSRTAFFSNGWDLSYLRNILPRSKFRQEAEATINEWPFGRDFVSVHRRNLGGTCHLYAKCPQTRLIRGKARVRKCTEERDQKEKCSTQLRMRACDIEYNDIPNPDGLPVVLFTDQQVPEKDSTFPIIFNASTHIFVEMLLMTKSRVHWGNPRSTVDIVVASWRQGLGMEPRDCYDPTRIHYLP